MKLSSNRAAGKELRDFLELETSKLREMEGELGCEVAVAHQGTDLNVSLLGEVGDVGGRHERSGSVDNHALRVERGSTLP